MLHRLLLSVSLVILILGVRCSLTNILFRRIIYECIKADDPPKKFQEFMDFLIDNYTSYIDNDDSSIPFRDRFPDMDRQSRWWRGSFE